MEVLRYARYVEQEQFLKTCLYFDGRYALWEGEL